MAYAVMQKTLDTLSTDVLKRAFRGVPGLTELDALTLGKEAFGILVHSFQLEPANALRNALIAQGVDAEVVDEATLPQLPEVQCLTRLDCAPEGLVLYDQLGRTASLEWKDVALVAAGRVNLTEFTEHKSKPPVWGADAASTMDGLLFGSNSGPYVSRYGTMSDYTVQSSTREERHERWLLEIMPTGAVVRYSINADKAPPGLLFRGLGERRTNDLSRNFTLLVQDILRGAPEAAINRGAYYLRENSATTFTYPSKHAFYSEITWLLWMLGKQAA
jgi:hypothetical protein